MAKRAIRKSISKTWEEALNGFLIWKQAQGISERTIKDYKYHISYFFSRFPQAYPQNIKPSVLELMAQPVKPATFNLRLVYMQAFFDWCIKQTIFEDNPLDGIKRRKAEGCVVNLMKKYLLGYFPCLTKNHIPV